MAFISSYFPNPESTDKTGLVAVTKEINANLLLDAYYHGIFPWSENPVRWYSPEPRTVFVKPYIKVPKRLNRYIRKYQLRITFDQAFRAVMEACAQHHQKGGTWVTGGFLNAYTDLHKNGYAHSVEVWQGPNLVGGIYGVQIGSMFAGESMFYRVSNASKIAFAYLVQHLERIQVILFDAQVINEFTYQLGAVLVRRAEFLKAVEKTVQIKTRYHGRSWPKEPDFSIR